MKLTALLRLVNSSVGGSTCNYFCRFISVEESLIFEITSD